MRPAAEIEAVAAAIRGAFVRRSPNPKPWDGLNEEARVSWRIEAQAAIETLDRVRAGQ